jgi:hypothetical protein
MSASLASPQQRVWRMSTSLASLAYFQKWPFWRVLALAKNGEFLVSTQFAKFACEWPLLRKKLPFEQTIFKTFLKDGFF